MATKQNRSHIRQLNEVLMLINQQTTQRIFHYILSLYEKQLPADKLHRYFKW